MSTARFPHGAGSRRSERDKFRSNDCCRVLAGGIFSAHVRLAAQAHRRHPAHGRAAGQPRRQSRLAAVLCSPGGGIGANKLKSATIRGYGKLNGPVNGVTNHERCQQTLGVPLDSHRLQHSDHRLFYSPFDQIPNYAPATRFVFLPLMVRTGLWIWKGHAVRRLVSRFRSSPEFAARS